VLPTNNPKLSPYNDKQVKQSSEISIPIEVVSDLELAEGVPERKNNGISL